MKKIVLIRHAESEANVGGVFEHSHTVKITDKGKQQAEDLREILDKPDRFIVSKYIRTIETAEPTINKYPDSQVHLWMETHEFTYINPKKIEDELNIEKLRERVKWYWEQNDPEYSDGDKYESFRQFAERLHGVILKLSKLDGINYVFTHGHCIRMVKILLSNFNKKDFENNPTKDKSFFKNLMRTFHEFYNDPLQTKVENTEVLDFTEQIKNYTK